MRYKGGDWVYLKGTKGAGRNWEGLNDHLRESNAPLVRVGDKVRITFTIPSQIYAVQIGSAGTFDFKEEDLSPTPILITPNRLELLNQKLGG